jgi:hypothetical protein
MVVGMVGIIDFPYNQYPLVFIYCVGAYVCALVNFPDVGKLKSRKWWSDGVPRVEPPTKMTSLN